MIHLLNDCSKVMSESSMTPRIFISDTNIYYYDLAYFKYCSSFNMILVMVLYCIESAIQVLVT